MIGLFLGYTAVLLRLTLIRDVDKVFFSTRVACPA